MMTKDELWEKVKVARTKDSPIDQVTVLASILMELHAEYTTEIEALKKKVENLGKNKEPRRLVFR